MKIASEQEMLDFGRKIGEKITAPKIFELIGDVGTGKTTFTRGLAKGLDISTPVTSPSFTISKSYVAKNGTVLTHYDFYRLEDPGLMAEDLAESISDKNTITVVEWGNSIANILPKDRTIIEIKLQDDGSREVTIKNSTQDISQDTPAQKEPAK